MWLVVSGVINTSLTILSLCGQKPFKYVSLYQVVFFFDFVELINQKF